MASVGPGAAEVEQREDQGGNDHAADGSECGKRRCARVAQFASHQLSFDLQRDHEEEERHCEVVDPSTQIEVEVDQFADMERDLRFPQLDVRVAETRVGPDQRDDGHGQHGDTASRLGFGEATERTDDGAWDTSLGRAPWTRGGWRGRLGVGWLLVGDHVVGHIPDSASSWT